MEPSLDQTISLLSSTPAALTALLGNLPDDWTHSNEGPNTWTPTDVIAHLIECDRVNWLIRTKIILEFGESKTFPPLDREARTDKPLPQLLDEFAHLRAENLCQLQALNLSPQDLAKRGQHPSFGLVTLSQLLSTWAAHDLTHLHQLSRILAHQYRHAVGPWIVYLGVLQCAGHSAPA